MSTSAPASPSRRLLVAIGMVGSPLCLAAGNLILPSTTGTAAQQLAVVHGQQGAYLAGSVLDAIGFGLLGALGVGIAMLLPTRGSVLATIAAVLSLLGGVVMGGAVLVSAVVESSLPVAQADALEALQSSPALGSLFDGALVASVGGLLAAIALLIGRPVRVWVPILLIVGMALAFLGGGPLSAVLSIPTIVAAALLAGALVRVPASAPVVRVGEPIAS